MTLYIKGIASLGIAGIVCGFLNFPFISEGDAVFAKPHLQMEYLGRERLSGCVCTLPHTQ